MPSNLLFTTLCLFALFISSCKTIKPAASAGTTAGMPKAAAEFRAAWVATVANINWPSKPGLPTDQQQAEAIALLNYLKEHHFNAVILQVRPQADALYQSSIEPWSYFLTGEQGKAPQPFYDPLTFWTEAAHDRGLELHVWLNPYRAHHTAGGLVTGQSVVKKHPS
ncbi:MAG: family 10 glycosylhydrolase, partial [Flaviaesturariibacter sp.]|nr:family 10 glycosylhydrolase [Flaviaesturariibacter sp.]